jgi:hypothetical protein
MFDRGLPEYRSLMLLVRLSFLLGRRPLDAELGLDVLIYDPQVHYQQVRDAWVGVRNPDGS